MMLEDWRKLMLILKRKRSRCLGLLVGAAEVYAFERQAIINEITTR